MGEEAGETAQEEKTRPVCVSGRGTSPGCLPLSHPSVREGGQGPGGPGGSDHCHGRCRSPDTALTQPALPPAPCPPHPTHLKSLSRDTLCADVAAAAACCRCCCAASASSASLSSASSLAASAAPSAPSPLAAQPPKRPRAMPGAAARRREGSPLSSSASQAPVAASSAAAAAAGLPPASQAAPPVHGWGGQVHGRGVGWAGGRTAAHRRHICRLPSALRTRPAASCRPSGILSCFPPHTTRGRRSSVAHQYSCQHPRRMSSAAHSRTHGRAHAAALVPGVKGMLPTLPRTNSRVP